MLTDGKLLHFCTHPRMAHTSFLHDLGGNNWSLTIEPSGLLVVHDATLLLASASSLMEVVAAEILPSNTEWDYHFAALCFAVVYLLQRCWYVEHFVQCYEMHVTSM